MISTIPLIIFLVLGLAGATGCNNATMTGEAPSAPEARRETNSDGSEDARTKPKSSKPEPASADKINEQDEEPVSTDLATDGSTATEVASATWPGTSTQTETTTETSPKATVDCVCARQLPSPFCNIYAANDPQRKPLKGTAGIASAAAAVVSPDNVCNIWCGAAPATTVSDRELQDQFQELKGELCTTFKVL